MSEATCPECGASVELPDDVLAGELIDCLTCGSELEVTSVDPAELQPAPDLAEDWGE